MGKINMNTSGGTIPMFFEIPKHYGPLRCALVKFGPFWYEPCPKFRLLKYSKIPIQPPYFNKCIDLSFMSLLMCFYGTVKPIPYSFTDLK